MNNSHKDEEKELEFNKTIEKLNNMINEKEDNIKNLSNQINILKSELENRENQLRIISNSLSWKLTKPLRKMTTLMRDILEKFKNLKKFLNFYKKTDFKTAKFWIKLENKWMNIKLKRKNEMYEDYQKWIINFEPTIEELELQKEYKFNVNPKISIVMSLDDVSMDLFRELLYSIEFQTYDNWELCLVNKNANRLKEIKKMCKKDSRIKYKFIEENEDIFNNINEAINLATGDYISLLGQNDLLALFALYEIVKCINENPNVEFIYTDEDKISEDDTLRYEPNFKPDYAPDTLRATNYMRHFCIFKNSLIEKIGLVNSKYNVAQNYDFVLRATENTKEIIHISKILYHERVLKKSIDKDKTNIINYEKLAIEDHLKRIKLEGKVFDGINFGTYGIDYKVIGNPKVSILIPNKDEINTLQMCLESIILKTTYENYEIIIIENNSKNKETFEFYKMIEKNPKIKVIFYKDKIFNYSKIINFGVKNSNADFILQLNNDTKLLTSNWLERMIGFCQRDDVGAVGVKLYYPDYTIQHAGVIVGCLQVAAHVFRNLSKKGKGYLGKEDLIQNMNAVTAACMMTKRSIYEEVGYMNDNFAVSFNDIDFCLKIREKNKLIVYNPYVELIHYESKTRGDDLAPDKIERFKKEINLFLDTWKDKLNTGDEYYNKNLSLDSDQYAIKTEK